MNTQAHNPFIKDTAIDTFDAGINGLQLLRGWLLQMQASSEAKFDLYEMQHFNDEVKQFSAAINIIDSLQNSNEAGIELLNHLVRSLEAQIK